MKFTEKLDLHNTQTIIYFIINNKPDKIIDKISLKITEQINNYSITKLSNIYSNLKININWTDLKYKELVILRILEDLFFIDLINYFTIL
tara:strand:- start:31 stop:300 length:270 start_codon:yes stop_codon:yes gene_type:complete